MKKIAKYLVEAGDDLEIPLEDIILTRFLGTDEKTGKEIIQIWCVE